MKTKKKLSAKTFGVIAGATVAAAAAQAAKARKAKERLKMKRLKGQGKAIPQPCRKHWGPQLAVFILVIIQIVPEFVCMVYMYASSDELSASIDTEAAAASMNKLNVFSVALGESDIKSVRRAPLPLPLRARLLLRRRRARHGLLEKQADGPV